jgi:hypothetical protein
MTLHVTEIKIKTIKKRATIILLWNDSGKKYALN